MDGGGLGGREGFAVDGGLWPVDEIQVDVLDVERFERSLEGFCYLVVVGVVPGIGQWLPLTLCS